MFRGARQDGADYFDDMFDENEGVGSLENDWSKPKKKLQEKIAPEGLHVQVRCWRCGREYDVTVAWDELVVCGENGPSVPTILPNGWRYSDENKDMYLAGMCGCGGGEKHEPTICPHFTPDECQKRVKSALAAGFIQPQVVAGIVQKVAQQRGIVPVQQQPR